MLALSVEVVQRRGGTNVSTMVSLRALWSSAHNENTRICSDLKNANNPGGRKPGDKASKTREHRYGRVQVVTSFQEPGGIVNSLLFIFGSICHLTMSIALVSMVPSTPKGNDNPMTSDMEDANNQD